MQRVFAGESDRRCARAPLSPLDRLMASNELHLPVPAGLGHHGMLRPDLAGQIGAVGLPSFHDGALLHSRQQGPPLPLAVRTHSSMPDELPLFESVHTTTYGGMQGCAQRGGILHSMSMPGPAFGGNVLAVPEGDQPAHKQKVNSMDEVSGGRSSQQRANKRARNDSEHFVQQFLPLGMPTNLSTHSLALAPRHAS